MSLKIQIQHENIFNAMHQGVAMAITLEEIFETVSMTLFHNLDIRSVTLGVNLKDCVHSDFDVFTGKVYKKVHGRAVDLIREAEQTGAEIRHSHHQQAGGGHSGFAHYGAVLPILRFSFAWPTLWTRRLGDAGVDFIGGYGALVHKGMTPSEEILMDSLPEVLSQHPARVFVFERRQSHVRHESGRRDKTGADTQ